MDRSRDVRSFENVDLVLTTYGTLRADAPFLKDRKFDCVILDEAQSIKNAQSATAKAALLLSGEQRIALSGTPIENHLGELWSLMEFLNPGLLGRASHFRAALEAREGAGPEGRAMLARAIVSEPSFTPVVCAMPPSLEPTDVGRRTGSRHATLPNGRR